MPASEFYADLQPATERIGLTERLDEERRAIAAQAVDLSADEIQARPLAATDLSIGRIVKHPRLHRRPLVPTQAPRIGPSRALAFDRAG